MNEMIVIGVQQVLPSNTPVILLREKEGETTSAHIYWFT